MLQQLRDKTKSVISSVLLGLLVISFGIWGIGDIFRMGGGKDWIAKIGGHKIPPQAVQQEFRNEVSQMRMMLGPEFTESKAREMGLVQRALDKVMLITSMNLETNRLGFFVPHEEIVRTLENARELRRPDGTFNREMFMNILSQQGLTEPQFIDFQKQIAARNLLIRGLSMPVFASQAAIEDMAAAMAQKRVAEIVKVDVAALPPAPYPTDEELQKYYDENKERYRSAETRNFKQIAITAAEAGKGLEVSEDDLKKAFEERGQELNTPETRDITQVVLATEEEAKAFMASSGTNISSAAKNAGKEAVKLEHTQKKDLPDAFGEAAFAATGGKVSGPVQSSLGWHVFVVDKIAPAKIRSFDEVKNELKAQLQKDKAAEHMVHTANKVDDLLASGKKLDDVAAALGLTVQSFENRDGSGKDVADKTGAKPSIPFMAETLKAAFQNAEGEISPLMESKEGGYILVEVTKINPAAPMPLADVRARLAQDMGRSTKAKEAEKIAAKVMEDLKAGKPLAQIAGTGISVRTSAPVVADNAEQKEVPREALAPLFDLRVGEVAAISTPEAEMVIRVKEVIPADKKDIEARLAGMKTRLIQEWQSSHVDELALALRNAYPPEIDEDGVKRLSGDTAQ